MTPAEYLRIDNGDRLGIRFGNLHDDVTFTHPCMVIAREDGVLRLKPEPLIGEHGSIGGKTFQEWLPSTLVLGRPGLSRRAEWHERGVEAIAREKKEAREEHMKKILRETGHVDDEGFIMGDVGALLDRLESMGFKLPEPPTADERRAQQKAEEAAELQAILSLDSPSTRRSANL